MQPPSIIRSASCCMYKKKGKDTVDSSEMQTAEVTQTFGVCQILSVRQTPL